MKDELVYRFEKLAKMAENINYRERSKRFYPLINYKSGKPHTFGLYDSKTKKHTLAELTHYTIFDVLDEMETMLRNTSK